MGYSSTLAVVALSIGSTYAWGWGGGDDSGGSSSSGSSGYGSGSSGSSSSGFGGSAGFSIPFGGDFEKAQRAQIAHGVLASLAFVIFFPFGAISIRLFSFRGLLWFHAIVQVLAYLIYIAAFGIGIYLATQIRRVRLGLQLANNTRKGQIAYGVVAGFVWVVYIISIFVGESKRRRDRKAAVRAEAEPKRNESDSSDSRIRTNYYA
ncbi:unnamed protein product [Aureobasidium pullulans]|nr:unnamed protein product [Aureobasidium pullulans]